MENHNYVFFCTVLVLEALLYPALIVDFQGTSCSGEDSHFLWLPWTSGVTGGEEGTTF